MKGFRCYEPFGGIVLKHHALFYIYIYIYIYIYDRQKYVYIYTYLLTNPSSEYKTTTHRS